MPQLTKVRMINPAAKKKKKFAVNRGAKRKKKAKNAARRRSKPKFVLLGGNPGRSNMAKKRKKAKRPGAHYRRTKRGFFAKGKNPRIGKKRHFRRRSNPLFPVSNREMIEVGGGAIVGGFGARMIPENVPFIHKYNSGLMGYGLNLVTTFVLARLAKWAVGAKAEEGAWVGGLLMTGSRIVSDRFGKTVVTFGRMRLGNDPAFNFARLGKYVQDNLPPLPVPTPYPNSGALPPLPVGTSLAPTAAATTAKAAPTTIAAASAMGYYGKSKYGANRFQ